MSETPQTTPGQPEQGRGRTAWEDEGSLVERLRTTPGDGSGVPDDEGAVTAPTGGTPPSSAASTRQTDAREVALRHTHSEAGTVGVAAPQARPHDLDPRAEAQAERRVAGLFLLAGFAGIAFALVFFLVDPEFRFAFPLFDVTHTVLLGLTLGIALIGIGAGPVLWAKTLMPHEEDVQERHPFASRQEDREATLASLTEGIQQTGIGRRKLILASLGFGGLGVGLAGAVPLFGLGPYRDLAQYLETTPFRAGSRLVRENGQPVRIGDLNIGGILTVFPEDDTHDADGPTILIRMRPEELVPLEGREDWVVDGHVAYSKICSHLGCPVGLYQQVTHQLLCPCHQSTFLASEGARVVFGPAARPLPQLPIAIDDEGYFIALSDYPEPIGPSYWSRG